jgi:hypothetical protein
MKQRILPLTILLLAFFAYAGFLFFLAVADSVAPADQSPSGPIEEILTGQPVPISHAAPQQPPPQAAAPTLPPPAPPFAPPFNDIPAASRAGATMFTPGQSQSCHLGPLPDQPTPVLPSVFGIERMTAAGAAGPGGLNAVLAASPTLTCARGAANMHGGGTLHPGIIPEVVDPPG